jgi:hypothetical protein
MTPSRSTWLLFLTSNSGGSASTPRVRVWRALKGLGVAILRDGVAVLPASAAHRANLEVIGTQVEADGGTYWLLDLPAQGGAVEEHLRGAFDRSDAYRKLRAGLAALRSELPRLEESGVRRRLRQAERDLDAIARTDFFPGDAAEQSREDLRQLVELTHRRFSPQEPKATSGLIERLETEHYRGRVWATRRRLWVDRVASAWLIRHFVDPEARFLWLDRPEDCPAEALGFDFDGAAFTHTRIQDSELVTFEVLSASFGLGGDAGLTRLGQLVHYLDAGGPPVAEAPGFEAVLAGLREGAADDDALLMATTPVLDALYLTYSGPRG